MNQNLHRWEGVYDKVVCFHLECGIYDQRGNGGSGESGSSCWRTERLKDVRYPGDQAMISDSEEGLQMIMTSLTERGKDYDIKVSTKKTKAMKQFERVETQ